MNTALAGATFAGVFCWVSPESPPSFVDPESSGSLNPVTGTFGTSSLLDPPCPNTSTSTMISKMRMTAPAMMNGSFELESGEAFGPE